MIIVNTISDLKELLLEIKAKNQIVGFVPTMGALHEGHLSLVKKSKSENDITVCSIFVNPTQFNNVEDFEKYPKTLESDTSILKNENCDVLFVPTFKEMYHTQNVLNFNFGSLENTMEGKFRPGHFSGVALIVSKFFHLIMPNNAYFGQKDFQQLAIVKQLVIDLMFDIKIHSCDTLREKNGLAMSSRNERLTTDERLEAALIFKSLLLGKQLLIQNKSTQEIQNQIIAFFKNTNIKLEYFEIANSNTLEPIENSENKNEVVICIAAFLGNVRLIDNLVL